MLAGINNNKSITRKHALGILSNLCGVIKPENVERWSLPCRILRITLTIKRSKRKNLYKTNREEHRIKKEHRILVQLN